MDHGVSMLSKKEKAGKGEKTGRKERVWNQSLIYELRWQSRTVWQLEGQEAVVKEQNVWIKDFGGANPGDSKTQGEVMWKTG